MLNVAAGINAAMEATRVNEVGEALSAGDIREGVKYGVLAFAGPARSGTAAPRRIFSSRALQRMADDPGPFHNFPASFDNFVFRGTRKAVSGNYVLYTQRGTINGVEGTFEIGVRPSASGRNETILHRFFRPDPEP
jgi:hypothetical protein